MTEELSTHLKAFYQKFGDVVPLRELPASVTEEELIEAIKISIAANENMLPSMFGFKELENNKDLLI